MKIKRIQVILDVEEGGIIAPRVFIDKEIPCNLGVSITQTKNIQPKHNNENDEVEFVDTGAGLIKIEWARQ